MFKELIVFRRYGIVEEIVSVICFLFGLESIFVSGSVYNVDGVWY